MGQKVDQWGRKYGDSYPIGDPYYKPESFWDKPLTNPSEFNHGWKYFSPESDVVNVGNVILRNSKGLFFLGLKK